MTLFQERKSFFLLLMLLLSAVLLAVLANVMSGKATLTNAELFLALTGESVVTYHQQIIWNLRVPRALIALLAGAMLGLAGALLQSITRNPLAEPGIMGVTAGSVFFAVVWTISTPAAAQFYFLLPVVSAAGGLIVTSLIFFISSTMKQNHVQIALIGVLISSIVQACTSFLLLGNQQAMGNVFLWIIGSLNGRVWLHFEALFPIAIVTILLGLASAGWANAMRLGDAQGRLIGLEVKKTRLLLLILAALLTAGAVSTVGAISFIGLIGPHMAKSLVGEDARRFFPVSMLVSAVLLLLADTVAQNLVIYLPFSFFNDEAQVPAGAITALLGAPFFIYLLRNNSETR